MKAEYVGCDVPSIIILGFILLVMGMEWYSLILQIIGAATFVCGVVVWAVHMCKNNK